MMGRCPDEWYKRCQVRPVDIEWKQVVYHELSRRGKVELVMEAMGSDDMGRGI